jgi:hypothetical protein
MADDQAKSGNAGFGLLSLLVGLAAGAAIYAIIKHRPIDGSDSVWTEFVLMQFVALFAMSWLLIADRGNLFRPIPIAAAIAGVGMAISWFLAREQGNSDLRLDEFPIFFWSTLACPLASYLAICLAKSALETGIRPQYTALFVNGLTLPLIKTGAALIAALALVLLYAWGELLKSMGVAAFARLFANPAFFLPFLGAVGGLAISMMRAQAATLAALRFILLLSARILMPIMAVFSLTFLAILAIDGPDAIFNRPYPGGVLLGLAFAGMLIFNGVYQNGESGPPALWLRLSTIVALLAFPVYAGLAAIALFERVGAYGLTPPRIAGLAMTFLAAAYSLVCLAGLISEINWRGKKWMPLVAPLNMAMAVGWIATLVLISSPLLNPWALSAASQQDLLLAQRVKAADFDFGYLRFKLGRYGDAALNNLDSAAEHPQATAIRAGVARARAAQSYWEYQNPADAARPAHEAQPDDLPLSGLAPDKAGEPEEGKPINVEHSPMTLELNPD